MSLYLTPAAPRHDTSYYCRFPEVKLLCPALYRAQSLPAFRAKCFCKLSSVSERPGERGGSRKEREAEGERPKTEETIDPTPPSKSMNACNTKIWKTVVGGSGESKSHVRNKF